MSVEYVHGQAATPEAEQERRAKIAAALTGRKHTAKSRRRMRDAYQARSPEAEEERRRLIGEKRREAWDRVGRPVQDGGVPRVTGEAAWFPDGSPTARTWPPDEQDEVAGG